MLTKPVYFTLNLFNTLKMNSSGKKLYKKESNFLNKKDFK